MSKSPRLASSCLTDTWMIGELDDIGEKLIGTRNHDFLLTYIPQRKEEEFAIFVQPLVLLLEGCCQESSTDSENSLGIIRFGLLLSRAQGRVHEKLALEGNDGELGLGKN